MSAARLGRRIHLGVVSTTIHGEAGYLPFDRLAAEGPFDRVSFYVAGDLRSAPFDVSGFRCAVHYLPPREQRGFRCSEEIGWNRVMRRNIALLRCIADRPDFILMLDDDNLPPRDFFESWHRVLTEPARREAKPLGTARGRVWHNYLRTAKTPVEIYPRGYPVDERGRRATEIRPSEAPLDPGDTWIFQGVSLGEPDVDAMTRIAVRPEVTEIHELDYGLRDVWSPYNTQNTVLAPDLHPLACVWPHCGRYDDVFASFTWQTFAFSKGRRAHIGNATNIQGLRRRNPVVDLRAEVEGIEACSEAVEAIASIRAPTATDFLEGLLDLTAPDVVVRQQPFFEAFRRDLEGVMTD